MQIRQLCQSQHFVQGIAKFHRTKCCKNAPKRLWNTHQVHVPNFWELLGLEDRGGGDNSIQIINFGRVGDERFKEWRQKKGGWKGG